MVVSEVAVEVIRYPLVARMFQCKLERCGKVCEQS